MSWQYIGNDNDDDDDDDDEYDYDYDGQTYRARVSISHWSILILYSGLEAATWGTVEAAC
eukprot:13974147-Heterocapsa_arctica.AAC.1